MSGEPRADAIKASLGAELCRYRRRPQKDILRGLGQSQPVGYLGPVILLMAAIFPLMPTIFLAERMGAQKPIALDPLWGPIVIAWYAMCVGLLAVFVYVLPRRVYLAIHENGFVYRKMFRCYAVGYGEIAQCVVAPNSRGLTLVLADSTRLWFQDFMILFPPAGIVQLLDRINLRTGATELRVVRVDRDLKVRFRRAGWLAGLVICAIPVIMPVSDAKSRAMTLKACGETVLGMSCYVFCPLVCAILFAPFVYVSLQLMVLMAQTFPTATGLYSARELRKARLVTVLGGIYFAVLLGGWIAYTEALGI